MSTINAQLLARNFVDKLPEFSGDTISSLVATVEHAEGATPSPAPDSQNDAKLRRGPALIHQPDGRNYFRETELPQGAEIACATNDCENNASLLCDSRDCEVLPYCKDCANVEHAMWLAGVRR